MTGNTQPEAGSTHIIRYALEMGLLWIDGDGRDKVREALDALDTLEAQLASAGFTAADMATAAAQRFRDGAASLAAAEAIPKALPTGWSLADHGDEISLEGPSGERWRYRAASGTGTDSDFIYRFLHASLSANAGEPPRDGWLHENGLLYRLTDERHPCNRDEINVTMADGSRSIEARSRCALELLDRIRAAPPTAQAEGWRLVPVEPTVAQREAMRKGTGMSFSETKIAYAAMLAAAPTPPAQAAQAASSTVLKAIREANMQLVRTGDNAFMLVPYKVATAQAAGNVPAISDLPPLPDPDLRDVGTKPRDVKDFLNGYATEYARLALAARAPAESVGRDAEDAARWRMLPAFFEEYQIDAMKLYRDIDAHLTAGRKQGGA